MTFRRYITAASNLNCLKRTQHSNPLSVKNVRLDYPSLDIKMHVCTSLSASQNYCTVGPCHRDFRSAGARYCGSLGENIVSRSVSSTTPTPLTLGHSTIKRKPETPPVFPVTCNHILEKGVMCMRTHADSADAAENAELQPSVKGL